MAGLVFLFSAAVPGRADEAVPDSATIRENVSHAGGPIPNAWREQTITTYSDGETSTTTRLQRGRDFKEIVQTGPFRTERGALRNETWHQNDNGQTIIDQPDPGLATREAMTTTVARVHTPVEAYVVATLNHGGFGSKEYVDPATWRLVRYESVGVNGTVTTTYDDFREDRGRTFAHHWHVDNAYAHTTSDTKVDLYDTAPVADADLAMPNSRRNLVEFPAGVTSVVLPTQFGRSHVIVRVMIGDRGLDFVLDTGSSGITIDEAVAKQLELPLHLQRSAVTAQRYTTSRTVIPEMRVGELVMRNVAAQVIPQGWSEQNGNVKTVGLLGFDFLAELGVTIDYEKERVTVVPEPAYNPPSTPRTTALEVRIGTGQPMTTVAINGAVGERFLLDTGGVGTFMIFDYFARRYPDALKDEGAGARSRPVQFSGVGGAIGTRPYQIARLQLGNILFTDFVGYRVISRGTYASATDGLIGADFLRLFTLGIDYANERIYLTPNSAGLAAMGIK